VLIQCPRLVSISSANPWSPNHVRKPCA
jgi:hypothetical protein